MGSFFAALLGKEALSTLLTSLISGLEPLFHDYFNEKITKEQLAERSMEILLSSFADVEKAYLASVTATYTAFLQAASQNKQLAIFMAAVGYSQLFVLLWHQFFIPLIVFAGIAKEYPSSGATVNWAYALVGACIGIPQIASRVGPTATWAVDGLKRLTGK